MSECNVYDICNKCGSTNASYVSGDEYSYGYHISYGRYLCKKCNVIKKLYAPCGKICYLFSKIRKRFNILNNFYIYQKFGKRLYFSLPLKKIECRLWIIFSPTGISWGKYSWSKS